MSPLARAARTAAHASGLCAGYAWFLATGRTPDFALRNLVNLFCLTGGRSNDVLSRLAGRLAPPCARAAVADVGLVAGERDAALAHLREHGYHVLARRLPADAVARLVAFALAQPCTVRETDAGAPAVASAVYERGAPRGVRYDIDAQALLRQPDVQALVADLSLVGLAQAYLGALPRLDVVTMWWHTAFGTGPDSRAAQFFHFDMDRPKWLKVFVFLTDVDAHSGPHVFVAGSHRTGAIPRALLARGQARLGDDDVAAAFGPQRQVEFTVPAGTIVVEDTRGLHKGRHVEAGDRLVLQFQLSNSLFGMAYPKADIDAPGAALAASLAACPGVYEAYS